MQWKAVWWEPVSFQVSGCQQQWRWAAWCCACSKRSGGPCLTLCCQLWSEWTAAWEQETASLLSLSGSSDPSAGQLQSEGVRNERHQGGHWRASVWLKLKQEKVMLGMYLYPLWWCSGLRGDYLIALWRPTYHWVRRRGWHLEYKTQLNDLNLHIFSLNKTDWVNYEGNSDLNVLLLIFQFSIYRSIGYICMWSLYSVTGKEDRQPLAQKRQTCGVIMLLGNTLLIQIRSDKTRRMQLHKKRYPSTFFFYNKCNF